jgi:hypothetical protein
VRAAARGSWRCAGAGRPEQSAGVERSAGAGRTGVGAARGAGVRVELRRGAGDSDIRGPPFPEQAAQEQASGCGMRMQRSAGELAERAGGVAVEGFSARCENVVASTVTSTPTPR